MTRLLTIPEAAEQLGVPKGSLKTAARKYGYIVYMGRTLRIDPKKLPELIEKCRNEPREQDSTAAKTVAATTSSAIPDAGSSRRALKTAERLKRYSRDISPKETDPPGRLHRIK